MQIHSLHASDKGAKPMSHVQSRGVTSKYAASQRPNTQVWLALVHYPTVYLVLNDIIRSQVARLRLVGGIFKSDAKLPSLGVVRFVKYFVLV